MIGNQAVATVIGFVPVVGDVGIAVFKTNFRNAALLEEYLRIRGEEFLKAQADRVEDPTVVKPGAGQEDTERIPGKLPSQNRFGFLRRSSKQASVAEETRTEDEPKQRRQTKPKVDDTKGKGKQKSE
jgi:hypothetical protein